MILEGTLNRTCDNKNCLGKSKAIFGFLVNNKRKTYLCEDCYKTNEGLME